MIKLRYPCRLGSTLYPAGTEVKSASVQQMGQVWPNIDVKPGSPLTGVWFPDQAKPTIVTVKQLVIQ